MAKKPRPNPDAPEIQELLPDNSTVFDNQPFIDNGMLEDAAKRQVLIDFDKKQARNKTARELAAEIRQKRLEAESSEDKARTAIMQEHKDFKVQAKNDEPKPYKPVQGMVNISAKGTTVSKVQKILNSLNINLEVQFTRTDTMNLLATLLTCNESQLLALYNNNKVPVVIKTVIKRLLDDSKVGSMDAIEKIWDRIFGKSGMLVDLPQGANAMPGVLPNQPVSREAYIVIRESLIGSN